jgi:hypothetical protein
MRRVQKLKQLQANSIDRNHVSLEHRIESLTKNIPSIRAWFSSHLRRLHEKGKPKHLLVPLNRAPDVGYPYPDVIDRPGINGGGGCIVLFHFQRDYGFLAMN